MVIGQPTLLVPLHARIPVPCRCGLTTHCLIRRAAIGVILFIGNDLRLRIELQAGRATVIAALIAHELHWHTRFVALRARLHERNGLLVAHDVQRLAFERDRAGGIAAPEDFEAAQIHTLFGKGSGVLVDHLAHPPSPAVVDIVDVTSTSQMHVL